MRRMWVVLVATVALVAAGCGSDGGGTAGTSAAPTSAADSTAAPSSAPDTSAPQTSAVETTAAATVPPAAGWTTVDARTLDIPLAVPCCASNWFGISESPPFPADGAPLADGIYRISFDWPSDPADTVTATVRRFAPCADLPTTACEQPPEGFEFTPDDLGVDPSSQYGLTLVLDGSLQVILGGFRTFQSEENFATGNGADLLDLVRSVDADFETAIMQPYRDGATMEDIASALAAAPAAGFGPPDEEGAGLLVYRHADAPPLLFQTLFYDFEQRDASRGSDVLGPIALQVENGTYTLTVYAGFYS